MVGYLPLGLLAASLPLVHAVPAADPKDPTITPAAVLPLDKRQQDAGFIGYLSTDGTWSSYDCDPGLTWFQDGKYAQCCPTTVASCPAPTACMSGSQVYPLPELSMTTTIACTENYQTAAFSFCNTILIFENTLDSKPMTNIACGNQNVRWSYYRSVDLATTKPSSTSDADATTTGPADSTGTASQSKDDDSKKSSTSKAWIAGAVVGPLVGLALGALGVFFCLRRKKKTPASSSPTGPTAAQTGTAMAPAPPINPSQPPTGVAGYTDSKPAFSSPHTSYYDSNTVNTYPQQGGFTPADSSPSPQYSVAAPYTAPSSPPPSSAITQPRPVYSAPVSLPLNNASELGTGNAPAESQNGTGSFNAAQQGHGQQGYGQSQGYGSSPGAELQGSEVGR